jgi:hypothetical protein
VAQATTRKRGVLPLVELGTLDLRAGSAPGRPPFLAAASGLVLTGDELCVVADDELHLGRFPLDGRRGRLVRLFPGDLPATVKKRKKRKPDLEVLLRLPRRADWPYGALLALGSGSTERRYRGALLKLGADGRVRGKAEQIDAAPLYLRLATRFPGLNLEGGWVQAGAFCLLQRGNRAGSPNAVLRFPLRALLRSLREDRVLPPLLPDEVCEYELGDVNGIGLGFTDASPLPDGGWAFSAVAENAADAIVDGPCRGAVIGRVDARSQVRWIRPVLPLFKIEGICAAASRGRLRALLVSDADDPAVPASLLQAEIS